MANEPTPEQGCSELVVELTELYETATKHLRTIEMARNLLKANRASIKQLQSQLAEMKATFDIRWNADMRAIKQWQRAHPGNDLVWPDHADLVVWLAEGYADLVATNCRMSRELAEARNRPIEGWIQKEVADITKRYCPDCQAYHQCHAPDLEAIKLQARKDALLEAADTLTHWTDSPQNLARELYRLANASPAEPPK